MLSVIHLFLSKTKSKRCLQRDKMQLLPSNISLLVTVTERARKVRFLIGAEGLQYAVLTMQNILQSGYNTSSKNKLLLLDISVCVCLTQQSQLTVQLTPMIYIQQTCKRNEVGWVCFLEYEPFCAHLAGISFYESQQSHYVLLLPVSVLQLVTR